jgi:hypothetical protein
MDKPKHENITSVVIETNGDEPVKVHYIRGAHASDFEIITEDIDAHVIPSRIMTVEDLAYELEEVYETEPKIDRR